MRPSNFFRWNLLSLGPARTLVRQAAFPLALQIAALVGFLALAINGWGLGRSESPADLLILRKTNLTTLVWGLWWPGMLVLVLFAGRL